MAAAQQVPDHVVVRRLAGPRGQEDHGVVRLHRLQRVAARDPRAELEPVALAEHEQPGRQCRGAVRGLRPPDEDQVELQPVGSGQVEQPALPVEDRAAQRVGPAHEAGLVAGLQVFLLAPGEARLPQPQPERGVLPGEVFRTREVRPDAEDHQVRVRFPQVHYGRVVAALAEFGDLFE